MQRPVPQKNWIQKTVHMKLESSRHCRLSTMWERHLSEIDNNNNKTPHSLMPAHSPTRVVHFDTQKRHIVEYLVHLNVTNIIGWLKYPESNQKYVLFPPSHKSHAEAHTYYTHQPTYNRMPDNNSFHLRYDDDEDNTKSRRKKPCDNGLGCVFRRFYLET